LQSKQSFDIRKGFFEGFHENCLSFVLHGHYLPVMWKYVGAPNPQASGHYVIPSPFRCGPASRHDRHSGDFLSGENQTLVEIVSGKIPYRDFASRLSAAAQNAELSQRNH
jgi:hypothetical protein